MKRLKPPKKGNKLWKIIIAPIITAFKPKPLTHYIITRKDLLPNIGFLAAQVTHAAGESIKEKVPPHTNAVVLSVESEEGLIHLSEMLTEGQIPHVVITEVDEPYTGQVTAIGLEPVKDRNLVRPYLSSLPLLCN